MSKFYDTNALLTLGEEIYDEKFYISSVTLEELENIKTSNRKDEQVKYDARKAIKLLDKYSNRYEVILYTEALKYYFDLKSSYFEDTPDNKICICAKYVKDCVDKSIVFVTDDICCRTIALKLFGLKVEQAKPIDDDYAGYKTVSLEKEELADFYEHIDKNFFNLFENEYLIIKDENGEVIDVLKWLDGAHQSLTTTNFKSNYYGTVKPFHGDVYQKCVFDSLHNNKITMIKGKAGSGKTYLALGFLFYLLEKHKIDKIVIFCNTVATINSAKLGYYPGTRDEKLLDSSLGNILASKLGGSYAVERLVRDEKIVLIPMSDARGYDTSDMNAGVYITEAQDMDISLMKLALQRIGQDSICIIDGDYNTQVDLPQYAGGNNGMRRASKIFRGQPFYGEIELKNIYRSKIAEIADKM